MKNLVIKIFAMKILMIFFILTAFESFGQSYYTYAVTDKFRRVGRYNVENDSVIAAADSISIQEAKSIIAVNAVRASNVQSEQNNIQIGDFILLIEDGKNSKTIKSDSDQLTLEMRKELQKVESGTKLTFKEISIKTFDGTTDFPKQTLIFVVE